MRLRLLQGITGLKDDELEAVKKEVITHTISALNTAKVLIEKKVDPDVIRQMMEGHGVSYDGKLKKFI